MSNLLIHQLTPKLSLIQADFAAEFSLDSPKGITAGQ